MSDRLGVELIERVQFFLDGGRDVLHEKAEAARDALRRDAWREQVARHQPAPSWTQLFASREHKRCVELALERTEKKPETTTLEILPLWTGSTAEVPGPHWFSTHGVLVDGELDAPWEISPVFNDATLRFDVRLRVTVERWRVAHVVNVTSYAPGVDLAFRGKHAGVIDGEVYKVCGVEPLPGEPRARPTRDVAEFCQWFEARVDQVEPDLLAKLEACQITPEPFEP